MAFLLLKKCCFAHSLADRKASDPGSFRPCLCPCSILQEPRQRAGGGIEVSSNHSSRTSFLGPHLCPAQTHSGADSKRFACQSRALFEQCECACDRGEMCATVAEPGSLMDTLDTSLREMQRASFALSRAAHPGKLWHEKEFRLIPRDGD